MIFNDHRKLLQFVILWLFRISNLCLTNLYVQTEWWGLFTVFFIHNDFIHTSLSKKECYLSQIFFSFCINNVWKLCQHVKRKIYVITINNIIFFFLYNGILLVRIWKLPNLNRKIKMLKNEYAAFKLEKLENSNINLINVCHTRSYLLHSYVRTPAYNNTIVQS